MRAKEELSGAKVRCLFLLVLKGLEELSWFTSFWENRGKGSPRRERPWRQAWGRVW